MKWSLYPSFNPIQEADKKIKLLGSAYVTEINYIKLLESLQSLHYTPQLTLFSRKIRKEKLLGSAYVTEINYIQLLETLQGLHYNPHLTVFLYTPNLTLFRRRKWSHQQLS